MSAPGLYSKDNVFLLNNLKGFAILFICLIHSAARETVYSFFILGMPLFAFASGFACKPSGNSVSFGYLKSVLTLYILANALYMPFEIYLMYLEGTLNIPAFLLGPNGGITWYFPALIIWYFLTYLAGLFKRPVIAGIVFSVLAYALVRTMSGTVEGFYWQRLSNLMEMVTRFFPCYLIGAYLPWEKIVSMRKWKFKYWLVAGLLPFFALYHFQVLKYYPQTHVFIQGTAYFAGSLLGVFAMLAAFPGMKIRFLSDIGKASLNIYLLHFYINLVANKVFVKTIGYSPAWLIYAVVAVYVYVLSRDFASRAVMNLTNAVKSRIFAK